MLHAVDCLLLERTLIENHCQATKYMHDRPQFSTKFNKHLILIFNITNCF